MIKAIDPLEYKVQIEEFYHSLIEEKLTFELSLELILSSTHLYGLFSEEGELLGFSGLRKKWCLKIFFVVVKKKAQGKGFGKQLTQICFDQSVSGPLYLTVERDNKKAQNLYRDLGMKVISVQKKRIVMMKARGLLGLFTKCSLFWIKPHSN